MKKKKTPQEDINDFLQLWAGPEMTSFLRDIIPLFELYDVDEEDDWVKEAVGKDNERNVRLIRTVYLMSKIAENHAARLCSLKVNFPNLWKKLEKEVGYNL